MNSYDKKIINPILIEKIISLETSLSKDELFDKCINVLEKSNFVSINYCKDIYKIKANYCKIFKHGIIEIEVRNLYGTNRLNIKVEAENNLYFKHPEKFILSLFLDNLNICYKEI